MNHKSLWTIPLLACLVGANLNNATAIEKGINKPFPEKNLKKINFEPSLDFNSTKAIKKALSLEQEYFSNYDLGTNRFAGRLWLDYSKRETQKNNRKTLYEKYLEELSEKSLELYELDCTTYAEECLKEGLESINYKKLKQFHNEIWPGLGLAGWSTAYILTEKFNWKAYLFISSNAKDKDYYITNFNTKQKFPVYNQPDIKLENYFIKPQQDKDIKELLNKQEFGWGFSEQGIHTWITNYNNLKECHWDGAPSKKYNYKNFPLLFETTKFNEFTDYNIHLIVFPPENQPFVTKKEIK